MILQLTRRMLERSGYTVMTAADGPSAVTLIQENPAAVDLVLLDMTMPGMTGDHVLWELRRLGCTAPIPVSYTHLRAHETVLDLVCRLLLEKKKTKKKKD